MTIVGTLTPTERASMIEALVADGHRRDLVSTINDAALKMYHNQISDPVNPMPSTPTPTPGSPPPLSPPPSSALRADSVGVSPPSERSERGGIAGVSAGTAGTSAAVEKPEKVHWKAQRSRLAELLKKPYDEVNEAIKAADWKAADVAAEIARLEKGDAPCPIVPKIVPNTSSSTMLKPPASVPTNPPMPPPPSSALRADSVGVVKANPPSERSERGGVAGAGTGAGPGSEPKPTMVLKTNLGGIQVPVSFFPGEVRWLDKKTLIPKGATPSDMLKLVANSVAKTAVPTTPGSPPPSSAPAPGSPPPSSGLRPDSVGVGKIEASDKKEAPIFPPSECSEQGDDANENPFAKRIAASETKVVSETNPPSERGDKSAETESSWPGGNSTNGRCILYIDCQPSFIATRLDVDILPPLQARVEAAEAAYYYGVINFGKGPALVASELSKDLATNKMVLPRHIVVNSFMPGSHAAMEILFRFAEYVVRASK